MENRNVPNYLVWSILATVFCCVPFGIVAIVNSSKVDTRLRMGDYEGAVEASRNAKKWSWISFGAGIAVAIIYLIIFMGGLVAGLQ